MTPVSEIILAVRLPRRIYDVRAQPMGKCGPSRRFDPGQRGLSLDRLDLPKPSPLMGMPGAGVELLGTLRSKLGDGFRLPEETWRVAA